MSFISKFLPLAIRNIFHKTRKLKVIFYSCLELFKISKSELKNALFAESQELQSFFLIYLGLTNLKSFVIENYDVVSKIAKISPAYTGDGQKCFS